MKPISQRRTYLQLTPEEETDLRSIAIAQNLLNQISATKEEDIRFIELNQLLLNLRANGRTIFSINADEEQELLSIANSGTKTSYKAQAILFAARGTDFGVALPALASCGDNWYTSFKAVQDKISAIYPNPAKNLLFFKYRLADKEVGRLHLYDLTGKKLSSYQFAGQDTGEIDISRFNAGLYLYAFTINNQIVKQGKLSIIK